MFEQAFEYIFFGAFAAIAAYFAFSVYRYGGFRGAMFGATVRDTIGEVEGTARGPGSARVRVHSLGAQEGADALVGLELVATSIGSWSSSPISLSRSEAQRLANLLQEAASR